MIKLVILQMVFFLSLPVFGKLEAAKGADPVVYSKVAKVHGMVCAFCSNSLEKKFKEQGAVESINVDLESKKVSVKFKEGKSIPNKQIEEMITASGFKVISIQDFKLAQVGKKIDDK